jgi:ATP-dependent Lon protease
MTVPLFIGREKSIRALEQATKADKHVLLVMQTNAADDGPSTDALFTTGTLAIIQQYLELPDGTVKADLEGVARARMTPTRGSTDFSRRWPSPSLVTPGRRLRQRPWRAQLRRSSRST